MKENQCVTTLVLWGSPVRADGYPFTPYTKETQRMAALEGPLETS